MFRKGRQGYRAPKNPMRGERHINTHLKDKDIIRMRRLYAAGSVSQDVLAQQFGINQATVSKIILRKVWHHVA